MRAKSVLVASLPLAILLAVILPTTRSHAQTIPEKEVPVSVELALDGEHTLVARRDPPELSGCNSRCRRVYCAESGSGRTYLCRCDCPK